ncbi:hypothetical protein glysoja_037783 [Glycine soja]|uniref:Uncharacterized protein n=1 Tax=Glycine soja TaxID=3848 RepID=A0A0B2R5G6_GLYSO|nr:hypothetical protein glysoja_037783 [Glycine soja]
MSSAYSFDSDLHDEEMEMEMDFLRERRRREIGDKICLLAQHWREALREAAGILGDSVSEFGKMDIANKIDYFVERWRDGLCVATRIPWRGMLIAEKLIDLLVKHWRETLCEALCEAVGFSDGADLYYRGKFANEISLLMKHWREALCEHNGIPLVFLLNFSVEEEIIRDFKDLMMSWKEALREAAGISRVVVLNYRMRARVENSTLKHRSLQDSDRHGTYMTSIAANRHVSQCTRSNIITTVNDIDADPLTWWFHSSSPSMLSRLQSFKHG